jgi:hypothetical protein
MSDMKNVPDGAPATKGDFKKLAVEIVKMRGYVDRRFDDLRAEMRAGNSRLLQAIDAFSGQVRKIDHHQVINDWRLDQIERRVKNLETPN